MNKLLKKINSTEDMHPLLRKFISRMLVKHYIGGKHTPEHLLLVRHVRHLPRDEKKVFMREYSLFREKYCIVLMKRTGRDAELHISLQPHRMKELIEELNNGNI
jgi:hypothetical protein